MIALRQRWGLIPAAAAAIAIAALVIWGKPTLKFVGQTLVVSDPLKPADIIVISADSGGPGVLEAADLVQGGIAARVAVFIEPPSVVDREYINRGLPYESTGARQMRQLRSLGVKTVLQIPITGSGTEGAGQALPTWSSQNSIRSMIFVAARDHTRRVRRVLDRNMKGHPTRIAIRPSRYSNFNPDRWWETRRDFRTAVFELQKLALDFVLHPMQ